MNLSQHAQETPSLSSRITKSPVIRTNNKPLSISALDSAPVAAATSTDYIRCICPYTHEDGFSIGCDKCDRWAHAACFGITKEKKNEPESWYCWECDPAGCVVDREAAGRAQKRWLKSRAGPVGGGGRKRKRSEEKEKEKEKTPAVNATVEEEEEELVDIETEFINIQQDDVPSSPLRDRLRQIASSWRGVTALLPWNFEPPIALQTQPSPSIRTTSPVPSQSLITPFTSRVTPLASYLADPLNGYAHLGMPKPYVHLIGKPIDVALDARIVGGKERFVRSGCRPNAVLRPFRPEQEEASLKFGVFALRDIPANEEVVLGWEWDDGNVVHMLPAIISGQGDALGIDPTHLRLQLDDVLHSFWESGMSCACSSTSSAPSCVLERVKDVVETPHYPPPLPPSMYPQHFSPYPHHPPPPMYHPGYVYPQYNPYLYAPPPPMWGWPGPYPPDPRMQGVDGRDGVREKENVNVDLGPLIGVKRGLRSRERIAFASGIGGVEEVDEELEEAVRKAKGKEKHKEKDTEEVLPRRKMRLRWDAAVRREDDVVQPEASTSKLPPPLASERMEVDVEPQQRRDTRGDLSAQEPRQDLVQPEASTSALRPPPPRPERMDVDVEGELQPDVSVESISQRDPSEKSASPTPTPVTSPSDIQANGHGGKSFMGMDIDLNTPLLPPPPPDTNGRLPSIVTSIRDDEEGDRPKISHPLSSSRFSPAPTLFPPSLSEPARKKRRSSISGASHNSKISATTSRQSSEPPQAGVSTFPRPYRTQTPSSTASTPGPLVETDMPLLRPHPHSQQNSITSPSPTTTFDFTRLSLMSPVVLRGEMVRIEEREEERDMGIEASLSRRSPPPASPTPPSVAAESTPEPTSTTEMKPPQKVKLSLKDFAMRKRKQREEEVGFVSPAATSEEGKGKEKETVPDFANLSLLASLAVGERTKGNAVELPPPLTFAPPTPPRQRPTPVGPKTLPRPSTVELPPPLTFAPPSPPPPPRIADLTSSSAFGSAPWPIDTQSTPAPTPPTPATPAPRSTTFTPSTTNVFPPITPAASSSNRTAIPFTPAPFRSNAAATFASPQVSPPPTTPAPSLSTVEARLPLSTGPRGPRALDGQPMRYPSPSTTTTTPRQEDLGRRSSTPLPLAMKEKMRDDRAISSPLPNPDPPMNMTENGNGNGIGGHPSPRAFGPKRDWSEWEREREREWPPPMSPPRRQPEREQEEGEIPPTAQVRRNKSPPRAPRALRNMPSYQRRGWGGGGARG